MKRYIRSSEDNTYLQFVEDAVNQSDLADVVESVRSPYPDEVKLTLVDPYRSMYYPRWKGYINTVLVVASKDHMDTGAPECYVILQANDLDVAVRKFNDLRVKIDAVTDKAMQEQQAENEKRAKNMSSPAWRAFENHAELNELIKAMCYEAYNNDALYLPVVQRYVWKAIWRDIGDNGTRFSDIQRILRSRAFKAYVEEIFDQEYDKYSE